MEVGSSRLEATAGISERDRGNAGQNSRLSPEAARRGRRSPRSQDLEIDGEEDLTIHSLDDVA